MSMSQRLECELCREPEEIQGGKHEEKQRGRRPRSDEGEQQDCQGAAHEIAYGAARIGDGGVFRAPEPDGRQELDVPSDADTGEAMTQGFMTDDGQSGRQY